jgi:hypothetical protein
MISLAVSPYGMLEYGAIDYHSKRPPLAEAAEVDR